MQDLLGKLQKHAVEVGGHTITTQQHYVALQRQMYFVKTLRSLSAGMVCIQLKQHTGG